MPKMGRFDHDEHDGSEEKKTAKYDDDDDEATKEAGRKA